MNSLLTWISNQELIYAIDELVERASQAHIEAVDRMRANKIDPFASILTAALVNGVTTPKDLVNAQALNSAHQGTTSAIGHFHQYVLSCIDGFENHDAGFDLINHNMKLIAEIKNKHNTMNASNRRQVESELSTAIRQRGRNWEAYLVTIIPRATERFCEESRLKTGVFYIDGASFYEYATGSKTALRDLFGAVESIFKERYPNINPDIWEACDEIYDSNIPG